MVSTPNIAETSKIEPAYEASDQRQYQVSCHGCGLLQPIIWAKIKFDDNKPETARFECRQCGHKHYENDKPRLLTEGKWVARIGDKSNKVAGFHLSSLYSPNGWYSWQNAVEDFLAAQKKPLQMKDWTNTVLGETWQDKGETVEHELLYQRFRILEPGNGYCHWPVNDCFDEGYFRQVTTEEKIRKYKHGVPYFQWDAKGRRSEALDCRVYSLTAKSKLEKVTANSIKQVGIIFLFDFFKVFEYIPFCHSIDL